MIAANHDHEQSMRPGTAREMDVTWEACRVLHQLDRLQEQQSSTLFTRFGAIEPVPWLDKIERESVQGILAQARKQDNVRYSTNRVCV